MVSNYRFIQLLPTPYSIGLILRQASLLFHLSPST